MAEQYGLHRLAASCERFIAVRLKLHSIEDFKNVSTAARLRMQRALLVAVTNLTLECYKW